MDEQHEKALNKARMAFNPDTVMVSYRLAKQLIESQERVEATLDYLRGWLNHSRDSVMPAAQLYNRLTGNYFDPAVPDKPLLGAEEDASPQV